MSNRNSLVSGLPTSKIDSREIRALRRDLQAQIETYVGALGSHCRGDDDEMNLHTSYENLTKRLLDFNQTFHDIKTEDEDSKLQALSKTLTDAYRQWCSNSPGVIKTSPQ